MTRSIILGVVLATIGCSTFPADRGSSEERDMAAAFRVVLTQLDKADSMTFVAGSGLSPAARRALRMVRPFVEVADVPGLAPKGIAGLPSGHFLVHSFTVTAHVAEFEATLGPVPAGPPNLSCGSGYRIHLERVATGWKVGNSAFIQC